MPAFVLAGDLDGVCGMHTEAFRRVVAAERGVPEDSLPRVSGTVSDTVEWLDRERIPYRDICFVADKAMVNADAYIEDAPHNVIDIRAAGGHAITFDQPYNAQVDGPRAHDWAEVEEIVVELLAKHSGYVSRPLPGMDAGSDRLELRTRDTA